MSVLPSVGERTRRLAGALRRRPAEPRRSPVLPFVSAC
jgi:hypothetical protein